MRFESCNQRNREGARFCDSCGTRLCSGERGANGSTASECISCGKKIDMGVYFTVCPHCGFNYRIEITPIKPELAETKRRAAILYGISILIPMAGFVVGSILSGDPRCRRLAGGCVALGAMNIVLTPILILKYSGLA